MHLLPIRLRRPPLPATGTTAVSSATVHATTLWSSTVSGSWAAPQPEPVLTLRLRPRRLPAPLPDADLAGPACGWHDSSRELHQGLEVTECAGWMGWIEAAAGAAQRAGAL